nr:MAG TPA: hypothetical protein [Caudoviricetes sp.]
MVQWFQIHRDFLLLTYRVMVLIQMDTHNILQSIIIHTEEVLLIVELPMVIGIRIVFQKTNIFTLGNLLQIK